jgi:hypothetical protein
VTELWATLSWGSCLGNKFAFEEPKIPYFRCLTQKLIKQSEVTQNVKKRKIYRKN